jgi:RNA recognition motif-containing protein
LTTTPFQPATSVKVIHIPDSSKLPTSHNIQLAKMSAAPAASVEKVPETKANDVAATTTSNDVVNDITAATEAAATSVAEGRRLYIGNVPYETKEEELKEFFKSYLM